MGVSVPHYHVAVIVADLSAARDRLTGLLGVTWGPVLRLRDTEYRDGAGTDLLLPTAFCYSAEQPSIELIEETPGTVWTRNDYSNLHHIGFWVDRLDEESAALSAAGCPLQLCGRAGQSAPETFAYHRIGDLGIRVELVDSALRDTMSFLFEPDHPAS